MNAYFDMEYIPTIGLEIHAELKTKSKMFCSCANNPDEKKPNVNVCPICLGHPGTLPVANESAIKSVLRLGVAIGGTLAETSNFDRKSYFYPDLPKGYQISQYDHPLVLGGELAGVKITRVHLEEDTGRLLHEIPNDLQNDKSTFIDFNRAGVPLMELVTEPVIRSGEETLIFAKELQQLLRYLGISDADMEKGQMRVEVNISLRKSESDAFGTKVEVKNLNSFRSAAGAVEFEIKRQSEILERGEAIIQETRGWNDAKCETVSQRSKESAHDYRYFPEPDLPPLIFSEEYLNEIKNSLPELPTDKRERFMREFGLSLEQAIEATDDIAIANFFEESASELKLKSSNPNFDMLFNYLSSDLKGLMKTEKKSISEIRITPANFAHLIFLIEQKISSRMAKDLILKMHDSGNGPETIISEEGLEFMDDDDALLRVVHEIIEANPGPVSDFKKGKTNALQFLVGQAMAKTKGQANPEKLRALFEGHLTN